MEKERKEEEKKKKEKGRREEEENPGLEIICVWIMFGNFLCDVWNFCVEISLCLSCVRKILLEVLSVGIR